MLRYSIDIPIAEAGVACLKRKMRHWATGFEPFVYLDSQSNKPAYWECLLAVGAVEVLQKQAGQGAFEALKQCTDAQKDWWFGFFGYDLKNETERLTSNRYDGIGLPDLSFFRPQHVLGLYWKAEKNAWFLTIQSLEADPESVLTALQAIEMPDDAQASAPSIQLTPRLPKAGYLDMVEHIREHIAAGDVYEMNLCQEFYAAPAAIDPPIVFERLYNRTHAPFTAFGHWNGRWLLCASPERFLYKKGNRLMTQPIKGTRRRSADPVEDEQIKTALAQSEKDRAENVMIVDLVRNDLARHCQPGSVQVEELFGIYTFATVHQMISTVTGQLRAGSHPLDALRDAFPMGSMTGAPKVMAMELIEQYERTRRGLFSGAVGYLDPAGDFDFNVVIRSIIYNTQNQYLSCQVGSAIVYDSEPMQEYEECLLKLQALQRSL
jgi:para-aminobenzoate synthetase component I